MPKVIRAPAQIADPAKRPRGTIGQYFATQHCPICEDLTSDGICAKCRTDPQKVAITLTERSRQDEMTNAGINDVSHLACTCMVNACCRRM